MLPGSTGRFLVARQRVLRIHTDMFKPQSVMYRRSPLGKHLPAQSEPPGVLFWARFMVNKIMLIQIDCWQLPDTGVLTWHSPTLYIMAIYFIVTPVHYGVYISAPKIQVCTTVYLLN